MTEAKTGMDLGELKAGLLVFFASVLIIVFMALYVHSHVVHGAPMSEELVAKNLTVPGKVYTRR